ncbi:MAG TPA: hypothetical protein VG889_14535 [Rhizomicrobium sp.]|nr:hypothetical protein [Rhizomicrobium sp.]
MQGRLSAIVVLASLACISRAGGDPSSAALKNLMPPGWECLDAPNSLDRPGVVFSVDARNVRLEVDDLGAKVPVRQGDVSSVSVSQQGRISASIFAKILTFGGLLDASGSLSGARDYSTVVILGSRKELRTDELPVRRALRENISPKDMEKDKRYFIIRNVQTARRETVIVDKSIAGALGINAANKLPFKALSGTTASGGAAISDYSASQYKIDATFAGDLTVCYLAQQFTSKTVGGGIGGSVVDVTLEKQYWTPGADAP